MCELDEPSSSDGPLHWPGFLAGITRYCKAPKSQRAHTLVGAYADGVVIGSAIVDLIEASNGPGHAVDSVGRYIADVKAALA